MEKGGVNTPGRGNNICKDIKMGGNINSTVTLGVWQEVNLERGEEPEEGSCGPYSGVTLDVL